MARKWLAATAVALLVAFAVPIAADHPQSFGAVTTTFDHRGGNEWWVEVRVTGGDIHVVHAIESDGNAIALRLNDWGNWVGSMHIEPGHTVHFQANARDGSSPRESCSFTHPAGVEQCSTPPPPPPPPPPAWDTTTVGASSPAADMALGDADNDGRPDISAATSAGVEFHEWTGTSWSAKQTIGTLTHAEAIAVGDGDSDGQSEIYAMSGSDLVRLSSSNGAWSQFTVATIPEDYAGDMTFGQIDGHPLRELYVGMVATTFDENGLASSDSTVYHVLFTNGWATTPMVSFFGSVDSLWVGDGDRDGSFELYMGHGTRHAATSSQVKLVSGDWRMTQVGSTGSQYGTSYVVAGDGDRDGKAEVYSVSDQGDFRRSVFANGAWTEESIMFDITFSDRPLYPLGLFMGDGDSDGSQELYFGTSGGDVVQLRWDGMQWKVNVVATVAMPNESSETRVVVGDGDGDGRREIYAQSGPGLFKVFRSDASGNFDATFTSVRGNEWWIQANVAASGGTLSKVDVRLNGGDWKPLGKQSWGGWAASYRAVQGTVVQLRATSTTGATDLSDCYRWIPMANQNAAKVTCGSPPPPPPSPGFDATFSGVKGNNWWVQANVAANQALAGVDARVNCGATWKPLTKQSWGGWAASFNIPSGSKVDFRATSTSGATDLSGGYIWPQATPTGACA